MAQLVPVLARWTRVVVIGGIIALAAFYLFRESDAPKGPIDPEILVSGLWWKINIAGMSSSLDLVRSSHRATLKTSRNGATESKAGTWTIVPNSKPPIVDIKLSGTDGETMLRLELVDSTSDYFLAPIPASSALLKDTWILDRDPVEE